MPRLSASGSRRPPESSPPVAGGSLRRRGEEGRATAATRGGGYVWRVAAGLMLLLVAAVAVPGTAWAQTQVPADWPLKPSGLSAAAGHTNIQSYSSGFTAVGSTADVDARDNTSTTYTSIDKGVPIYWLDGAKVADDYENFYDGTHRPRRWLKPTRAGQHGPATPKRRTQCTNTNRTAG